MDSSSESSGKPPVCSWIRRSAAALLAAGSAVAGAVIASLVLRKTARRSPAAPAERGGDAEEQYRTFFENAVEGIFQTTPDGHYLRANPMLAQIYGYDRPADLMADLTDIRNQLYVDKGRRNEFRNILEAEDAVWGFESQVCRKDGRIIWISENARAIRTAEGQLTGYEGTVLDITARKQAEAEVAGSRKRERATASKIQQTLLLGVPPRNVSWLSLGVLTVPSQEIDGDFYDFFRQSDACLDLIFGDVMGKGIPAALLGAAIKSRFLGALAQLALGNASGQLPEPEQVIRVIHSELTAQFIGLESFATLCYLRFDRAHGMVTYVDCGHTKTIHYSRRRGVCETLEGRCVPLGFTVEENYTQNSLPLEPGDLFVCYSDGVTEAQDADGEGFGETRLLELIQENKDRTPSEVAEQVWRAVIAYHGSAVFADDVTVIAIRLEPS